MNLVLAGLIRESTVDGPGIRLTLFLQGCPHHCVECHNPDTWDPEAGEIWSVHDTLELIRKKLTPLHQGITISGGEPFLQPEALLALVKGIKKDFPGLNIWCYSGYLFEELITSPVLPYLDVLVDGPFMAEAKDLDLTFRGSRNQRIINVAASLHEGRAIEVLQ